LPFLTRAHTHSRTHIAKHWCASTLFGVLLILLGMNPPSKRQRTTDAVNDPQPDNPFLVATPAPITGIENDENALPSVRRYAGSGPSPTTGRRPLATLSHTAPSTFEYPATGSRRTLGTSQPAGQTPIRGLSATDASLLDSARVARWLDTVSLAVTTVLIYYSLQSCNV
jgi:hypothetical protein